MFNHSSKHALNDVDILNERCGIITIGAQTRGNGQIISCKQQVRKFDGNMTHDKWHSHNRAVLNSVEMDEENVTNVGSLAWNGVQNIIRYLRTLLKNITQNTYIAGLYHKKASSGHYYDLQASNVTLMFHFICVSELLGSAKKVNVNFQDTDGWVTLSIIVHSFSHPHFLHSRESFLHTPHLLHSSSFLLSTLSLSPGPIHIKAVLSW